MSAQDLEASEKILGQPEDVDEPNITPTDQKDDVGINISSTVLGSVTAATLRRRFDKEGNNKISADELAEIIGSLESAETKADRRKKGIIVSIAGIIILLLTSFATAWLAVSLQRDLETDNDTNQLKNRNNEESVSTLTHSHTCKVDFSDDTRGRFLELDDLVDHPAYRRLCCKDGGKRGLEERRLCYRRNLSERNKPSFNITSKEDDSFLRRLQGATLAFVDASCVHSAWKEFEKGDMGTLQVEYTNAVGHTLSLVSTTIVIQRIELDEGNDEEMIVYGPLYEQYNLGVGYGVRCPKEEKGGKCQIYIDEVKDGSSVPNCFSAVSKVALKDSKMIAMGDLKIGDEVMVGPNKYEPVYGFSDREIHAETEFLQIFVQHTEGSQSGESLPVPLEITSKHLIYRFGEETSVPAGTVKVGDKLVPVQDDKGSSEPLVVSKIEKVVRPGRFSPLTASGKIVVDGIIASAYVTVKEGQASLVIGGFDTGLSYHYLLHLWYRPYYFYCRAVSSDRCQSETYDSRGVNLWTSTGLAVNDISESSPAWVQVIIYTVLLPIFLVLFGCVEIALLFFEGMANNKSSMSGIVIAIMATTGSWAFLGMGKKSL